MEKVPYIELFSSAQKWRTDHYEKLSHNINSNTQQNFYRYNSPSAQTFNKRSSSVNNKNQQRPFSTNYYDQALRICADNKIIQGITSPTYNQLKKFDFIKTNNCNCNYQTAFHQHTPNITFQKQKVIQTKINEPKKQLTINLNSVKQQVNNQSENYSTTNYMDNVSELLSKEGTDRFSKGQKNNTNKCLSPRDYLKETAQFNSKSSIRNDICLQKTNSKKIVSFKQISNTVINSQIIDPQRVSLQSARNPSKNDNNHLNTNRINKLITNLQTDLNKKIKELSVNDKETTNNQWMLEQLQQIKEQNIMLNKEFVMKLDHILTTHNTKNQIEPLRTLQMSKSASSLRRKKLFVTQAEL